MNNELDDLAMEYERVHAAALITEKRGKNFDKVLGEWQSKAADVSAEVAASQDEGRNYTSELFRLKAAGDEGLEQLDIVKRENKVIYLFPLVYIFELTLIILRPSPTRSRISWTRSARAGAPSARLTKSERGWKVKSWSCRLPWRKLKVLLSRKRTRFSGPSLS